MLFRQSTGLDISKLAEEFSEVCQDSNENFWG